MSYALNINGQTRAVNVDGDTPLLWVLRDVLGMTGTKFGCAAGLCGACTVQVDGEAQRSCQMPVSMLQGKRISTIEAMADDAVGQRVQDAWLDIDVVQCGYCQPGQIVAATALLTKTPDPTDEQIDEAMAGNICRCGTYPRIRAAIHKAAKEGQGGGVKS